MKLIDFSEFKGFQYIKKKMGIPKEYPVEFKGKVEAKRTELDEVTWKELNEGRGIDIELKDIKKAEDGTLEYKGAKIALYIRDQEMERDYKFHVAWCRTLESMDQGKRLDRYVASRKIDGTFSVNYIDRALNKVLKEAVERKLNICKNCLTALNYKEYAYKSYNEKDHIYNHFSLEEFLEKYDTTFIKKPKNDYNTAPMDVYPDNWNEISYAIRKVKEWRCEKCGENFEQNKGNLHVHHIDGVKGNIAAENLRVLCKKCHSEEPYHRLK